MMFQVGKEQLVRTVYALRDVLNCLRAETVPSREAFRLFELREMFLERIHIEVLVEHTVVPTMQGNAVVVDIASNVYLPMQFLVSPRIVQLEPVCSHDYMYPSLGILNTFTI